MRVGVKLLAPCMALSKLRSRNHFAPCCDECASWMAAGTSPRVDGRTCDEYPVERELVYRYRAGRRWLVTAGPSGVMLAYKMIRMLPRIDRQRASDVRHSGY